MPEPKESTIPPMPPTPDQAYRDVVDFEDFELVDIPWKDDEADFSVQQSGKLLGFKAERWGIVVSGTNISLKYKFAIFLRDPTKKENLQAGFEAYRRTPNEDPAILVKTNIARIHPQADRRKVTELPRGIGRVFYQKMLDYIITLGKTNHVSIKHRIIKQPDTAKITAEEWDKFFMPIIQDGYKKVEDDQGRPAWERIYEPKK